MYKDWHTIAADGVIVKVFSSLRGGEWVYEPHFQPLHKHGSNYHDSHCSPGLGRRNADYGVSHIAPERASSLLCSEEVALGLLCTDRQPRNQNAVALEPWPEILVMEQSV